MLFMPSKLMTDHFNSPATKYTDYWMRGMSVSIATSIYCMLNLPEDIAAKAMLGLTAGTGALCVGDAKFGYLSKLEAKYPMHYLPEALIFGLIAAGVLALKK